MNTTRLRGLSQYEADKRLAEYGPNRLRALREVTFVKVLKEEIMEPMILLLICVAVAYLVFGEVAEGIAVLGIISGIVLIEVWTEYRAKRSVSALSRLTEPDTMVIRDGDVVRVPVEAVVPGDLLLLRAGSRIPADAALLHADDFAVDESSLSGESLPVGKIPLHETPLDEPPLHETPLDGLRSGGLRSGGLRSASPRREVPNNASEGLSSDGTRRCDLSMAMVYRGTLATRGEAIAEVTATGRSTKIGRIMESASYARPPRTALQMLMRQLSKALAIVAILFAVIIPILLLVQGKATWQTALLTGLSMAFATIPEELPILITIVLGFGSLRLARENALVKELKAAETLGHVTAVVCDKTGTLTTNRLRLAKTVPATSLQRPGSDDRTEASAISTDVENAASMGVEAAHPIAKAVADSMTAVADSTVKATADSMAAPSITSMADQNAALARDLVLSVASLSLGVQGDQLRFLIDPVDRAIGEASRILNLQGDDGRRCLVRFPFSSERGWSGAIWADSTGSAGTAYIKGTPETIITGASSIAYPGGETQPISESSKARALAQVAELAAEGYRVLAVAVAADVSLSEERRSLPDDWDRMADGYGRMADDRDRMLDDRDRMPDDRDHSPDGHGRSAIGRWSLVGFIALEDPVREEAVGSVRTVRKAGVSVYMATGDHPQVALAVARQVGIETNHVLTGDELDALSDEGLRQALADTHVFARIAPDHKLRIVQALQSQGQVVAMTGDGSNDAPALRAADVGVAMGLGGTDAAREASSLVLADDRFATLVTGISEGRGLFNGLRKAIRYYLAAKVGLISAMLVPTAFGMAPPFSPPMIILLELFMDLAASTAFIVEPIEKTLMDSPPWPRAERFLDQQMVTGILGGGVVLAAAVIISSLVSRWSAPSGEVAAYQSGAFVAWMLGHIALAYQFRSWSRMPTVREWFANRVLNAWALAATATAFLVTNAPFVQRVFDTESLSGTGVALVAVVSVGLVSILGPVARRGGSGSGSLAASKPTQHGRG